MEKLGFFEYLSTRENLEGSVEPEWVEYYRDFFVDIFKNEDNLYHHGDCTRNPYTCNMCFMESSLENYRKYFFEDK